MTLKISFELSPSDLEYFRRLLRDAHTLVGDRSEADIVTATRRRLPAAELAAAPGFMQDCLGSLGLLTDMLTDEQWCMPGPERRRVLFALAYFAEADNLIPDHVPGVGFLDDAVLIELVTRELRHEIAAYQDFLTFCRRAGDLDPAAKTLANRRRALHERMRRRADREIDKKPGTATVIRLF